MTKVLFVLTSTDEFKDGTPTGLWLEEAAAVYHVLDDAGIEVELSSIKGGSTPVDPNSVANNELEKYEGFSKLLQQLKSIDEVNSSDYDAVYFPGGHGTVFDYANNEKVSALVQAFIKEDKWVSAVCHGPSAFVGAKDDNGEYLVKDIKITGFTDSEEKAMKLDDKVPFLLETELRKQGAEFESKDDFSEHVIESKPFITGQNPQSSEGVGVALKNALKG
ncbi:type 1 glutamine amidotransferase domain-containing protein [Staphylococcus massiliensis CCUG 55927]|uniref:Intracellular protease amidase n=2 Tax=Staphylococcus massiliensis TaxID=555791 RepID=K9AM03_9STAP|nr:type 1 glutamine amidotransferase domain-containing protein [Staphylococcus massiliensis]EKU47096.1 intracellular protease amidase [Staphylococcus massiliensis S46]PNZ98533.1 type 1 glutamine amidotransferase domain-containing protein [Staphylococcus massiliensis CCUG 55927]